MEQNGFEMAFASGIIEGVLAGDALAALLFFRALKAGGFTTK
jgi:hypothetical protein